MQIWPSLYVLTRSWPDKDIFWGGSADYTVWTEALGLRRAPWQKIQAANKLYSAQYWPEELQDWHLIWFGLLQSPVPQDFSRLWFLPGLETNNALPVREKYLQELGSRGLDIDYDWHQAWLKYFQSSDEPSNKIHILPGAGHPAKCWPWANYLHLARKISNAGLEPVFVLGPVEKERQFEVQNFESIQPGSLAELQSVLQKSRLVLGNDSGPLHLAGYLRPEALVLFGPSCPVRWTAYQAKVIQKDLYCNPCSLLARIDCEDPVCMRMISVDEVYQELTQQLAAKNRTGPSG